MLGVTGRRGSPIAGLWACTEAGGVFLLHVRVQTVVHAVCHDGLVLLHYPPRATAAVAHDMAVPALAACGMRIPFTAASDRNERRCKSEGAHTERWAERRGSVARRWCWGSDLPSSRMH